MNDPNQWVNVVRRRLLIPFPQGISAEITKAIGNKDYQSAKAYLNNLLPKHQPDTPAHRAITSSIEILSQVETNQEAMRKARQERLNYMAVAR